MHEERRRRLTTDQVAFLERHRSAIARLPREAWLESIVTLFGCTLRQLDRAQILALRADIVAEAGEEQEFVELIDGHLAWRDLQADHDAK